MFFSNTVPHKTTYKIHGDDNKIRFLVHVVSGFWVKNLNFLKTETEVGHLRRAHCNL